jgi:ABC-type nitrate/sulfonate/bicarbonate transport system permease component
MVQTMARKSLTQRKSWFNLSGFLFIVGITVVWELVVRLGLVKLNFLPAPDSIIAAMITLTSTGQLPADLFHTFTALIVGWLVGSTIGLVLGAWLGLSHWTWVYSMASIEVLRALPAIAFVPVAVLLLGFSVEMEFVIIIYVATWPVLINTIDGVRSVSDSHREIAQMMRMTLLDRLRKVVLPSAAPTIYVGLRLSLALSLALAIVAEMVGNPQGMGYQLILQQQALQPAAMFAYIIVVGLLGLLLNSAFVFATSKLSPGITAVAERTED